MHDPEVGPTRRTGRRCISMLSPRLKDSRIDVRTWIVFRQQIRLLEGTVRGADDFADAVAGVAALADPDAARSLPVRRCPAGAGQSRRGVGRARGRRAHGEVPPRQAGRGGTAGHRVQRLAGREARGGSPDQAATGGRTERSRSPCPSAATTSPASCWPSASTSRRATAVRSWQRCTGPRRRSGRGSARGARDRSGGRPSRDRLVDAACTVLARHGYEPSRDGRRSRWPTARSTRSLAITPRWSAG